MIAQDQWLDWAVEIQSLAQAGLAYGQNPFDIERYTRLRAIAAEMVAAQTDLPLEKVLPFATSNPADMLGIADKCGRIQKGLRADFIRIADPTSPAITDVWCAGKCVE